MSQFASIKAALKDLQEGRMIILVDDERREQEGDIIIAAEKITPEAINFMATHARGLICLTLTQETVERLQIPLMPVRNQLPNQAAFTVSIEAAEGVTTGVSAYDRAHTIQVAVNPTAVPQDVSTPGHVFPLRARQGGVLVRPGHTEGSVDLARLAGLQPAAVICEIMRADGKMARLPDLQIFAEQHQLKLVTIQDLISYRLMHETVIEEVASSDLHTEWSDEFTIKVFRQKYDDLEHVVLIHKDINKNEPCIVRIHSECITGDLLGSTHCDCGGQLKKSLAEVAEKKGILLYMRQEGRGIGLTNKIKAYDLQQTLGLDTVEANHKLGLLADNRSYGICAQMLRQLGVNEICLLTNNPRKLDEIKQFGIRVIERLPLETEPHAQNIHYLATKRDKLGHLLKLDQEKILCKF